MRDEDVEQRPHVLQEVRDVGLEIAVVDGEQAESPVVEENEALRRTEGRLFFASADSAPVWRSFITGAIDSGYRAAREIDCYLAG
jgi:monoamine oxidase